MKDDIINNKNKQKDKHKNKLSKINNIFSIRKYSILFLSSLLFITNILSCYYKNYYLYSYLFMTLLVTSLVNHSYKDINICANLIDKLAIIFIIIYGGNMLYNKSNDKNNRYFVYLLVICFTFLYCAYSYVLGFFLKKYCFDTNLHIAHTYHVIMHLCVSIGHHLITFL